MTHEELDAIEARRIYAMAILGGFSNPQEPLVMSVEVKKGMEACLRKLVFEDVPDLISAIKTYETKKEA